MERNLFSKNKDRERVNQYEEFDQLPELLRDSRYPEDISLLNGLSQDSIYTPQRSIPQQILQVETRDVPLRREWSNGLPLTNEVKDSLQVSRIEGFKLRKRPEISDSVDSRASIVEDLKKSRFFGNPFRRTRRESFLTRNKNSVDNSQNNESEEEEKSVEPGKIPFPIIRGRLNEITNEPDDESDDDSDNISRSISNIRKDRVFRPSGVNANRAEQRALVPVNERLEVRLEPSRISHIFASLSNNIPLINGYLGIMDHSAMNIDPIHWQMQALFDLEEEGFDLDGGREDRARLQAMGPSKPAKEIIFRTGAQGIKFNQVSCSICWNDFTPGERILKLRCEHVFHISCLTNWSNFKKICPFCSQGFCLKRTKTSL